MTSKKIYIIEDHPYFIDLYKAIFNKINGIEIYYEMTGNKGIEMIKAGEPNLIILDYKLPDMDGIYICEQLRKIERLKDIPIIAVSSSPINGNKEELFSKAGFSKYIDKPLNLREFRELILTYLF
jgi:CheY-like chemotaxis protein